MRKTRTRLRRPIPHIFLLACSIPSVHDHVPLLKYRAWFIMYDKNKSFVAYWLQSFKNPEKQQELFVMENTHSLPEVYIEIRNRKMKSGNVCKYLNTCIWLKSFNNLITNNISKNIKKIKVKFVYKDTSKFQ